MVYPLYENSQLLRPHRFNENLDVKCLYPDEPDINLFDSLGDFANPVLQPRLGTNRHRKFYVRWVQSSLNQVDNAGLVVDGLLGRKTRQAIRNFQKRASIRSNGRINLQTEQALVAYGASPFISPTSKKGRSSAETAPALIKHQKSPAFNTLFVKINLGVERPAQPMTGIFIPKHFKALSKVDIILYLHGYKSRDFQKSMSIDRYWQLSKFAHREQINSSQKNVVLVAPTLGPKSQAGRLLVQGGLDSYLQQVMMALKTYGPHASEQRPPTLRHLILAGHSAGGGVMRKLIGARNQSAAHIRECWGFDCFYSSSDPRFWASWAASHPTSKVFVYFINRQDCNYQKPSTRCKPTVFSQYLKRKVKSLSNVFVLPSKTMNHDKVPLIHLKERIQQSNFLVYP